MSDAANDAHREQTSDFDPDRIESDLADVEVALARLDAGTYWTCEVSGRPLPDELLASKPTARRLAP